MGVAGTAVLAFALTGCGSAAQAPNETGTSSTAPAPQPTTYYGQTAAAIAALVPGCSAIQAGDIGKGGPNMASTASCIIGGRTVDFYSWSNSQAAAGVVDVLRANKDEVYYAAGTGWTAHVRRDMNFQWQLTNNAASLIRYASENHPKPAADLPGEKATSQQIADAIGGSVVHAP